MARETTITLARLYEIDHAEERLGFEVARLLREAGWKYTCDTPGSYWMWEKEIEIVTHTRAKGQPSETRRKVVALVDQETAVRLELHLNPPEEDEDDGG